MFKRSCDQRTAKVCVCVWRGARRPPQILKDSRETSETSLWQPHRRCKREGRNVGESGGLVCPACRAGLHPPAISFLSEVFLNHGTWSRAQFSVVGPCFQGLEGWSPLGPVSVVDVCNSGSRTVSSFEGNAMLYALLRLNLAGRRDFQFQSA